MSDSSASAGDGGRRDSLRFGRLREPALLVATLVGLAASTVHWSGLVLGGVLVGLIARSLPRALVNGLTFGLVVVLAFGGWLVAVGALSTWATTGLLALVSVASAFVLPALGALAVRSLV